MFVPFSEEPEVAVRAFRRAFVHSRAKCVPGVKHAVRKQKSLFTKVSRALFHGTTTSDYAAIERKGLLTFPVGSFSYLAPEGKGSVIEYNFGQAEPGDVYRGLYETWFIRCGYLDQGLVATFLGDHPSVAETLYIAKAIGVPVAKGVVTKAAKLGLAGAGSLSSPTTTTNFGSMGRPVHTQVIDQLKGAKKLYTGVTKAGAQLTGQAGHKTYHSAVKRATPGQYPSVRTPAESPYGGGNLFVQSSDASANMPYLPGRKEGNELIREFEASFRHWVVVTQVTPIQYTRNGAVWAHRKRIVRVRSMSHEAVQAFQQRAQTKQDAPYAITEFCAPDSMDQRAPRMSYAQPDDCGVTAYFVRESDSLTPFEDDDPRWPIRRLPCYADEANTGDWEVWQM